MFTAHTYRKKLMQKFQYDLEYETDNNGNVTEVLMPESWFPSGSVNHNHITRANMQRYVDDWQTANELNAKEKPITTQIGITPWEKDNLQNLCVDDLLDVRDVCNASIGYLSTFVDITAINFPNLKEMTPGINFELAYLYKRNRQLHEESLRELMKRTREAHAA